MVFAEILIQILSQLLFCVVFSYFVRKYFKGTNSQSKEINNKGLNNKKLQLRSALKAFYIRTLLLNEDKLYPYISLVFKKIESDDLPKWRKYLLVINITWPIVFAINFFYELLFPRSFPFMLNLILYYFSLPILGFTYVIELMLYVKNKSDVFSILQKNIKEALSWKQSMLLVTFPLLYMFTIQMRVIYSLFIVIFTNKDES